MSTAKIASWPTAALSVSILGPTVRRSLWSRATEPTMAVSWGTPEVKIVLEDGASKVAK